MTTELFTQGTINTNNLNSDYSHNTVHKALEERQIYQSTSVLSKICVSHIRYNERSLIGGLTLSHQKKPELTRQFLRQHKTKTNTCLTFYMDTYFSSMTH